MRRRLLFSYLTLTLVVLLLLEAPLGIVYAREQRRRLTASVERDALALSIRAEEAFENNGTARFRAAARAYQADTGGRVVVIRPSGSVVVDSDPNGSGDQNFRNRLEFKAALARHEVNGSRYSATLGHDILYFAVPIVNGSTLVGALRLTFPTSYVDARIQRGWWVLIGIGLVALLVVFLVSLRLARQVTIPIERLAAASARVGRGDLDTRAEVPRGPPELRELTEQFNTTTARLERLVHAQQGFVADASHQLRTPLAALRLRLENLESEVSQMPDATADVAGSLTEVGRLSRLVDGLLALARAEQATMQSEPLAIAPIVAGRVDAWRAFAEEHDVTFAVDVHDAGLVLATPERLEQVLDNLIANAIEVAPAGTEIRLSATTTARSMTITVADEGPGLSESQRARAFDRFWRSADGHRGAGLGLAIVRQLVEADGGSVSLEAASTGGLAVVLRLGAALSVPAHA